MDLLSTFASLANVSLPKDPIYDGENVSNLFFNPDFMTKERVFFYRWMDELHGVRSGNWKLMVKTPFKPIFDKPKLYNLSEDIGEYHDVAEQYPDVAEKLMKLIIESREDLGDTPSGVQGKNIRPLGFIYDAKTLTKMADGETKK